MQKKSQPLIFLHTSRENGAEAGWSGWMSPLKSEMTLDRRILR